MVRCHLAFVGTAVSCFLILYFRSEPRHSASFQSLSMANTDHFSNNSNGAVRLVVVSDTHRSYSKPIPHGDVLIHCGDSELSPEQLSAWLSQHGHARALAISGNMDYLNDKHDKFPSHITYLQDSATTINGLRFYGSPWTPEFVGAFQLYSNDDARKVWENVPQDVDVLITHGPPAGILDRTSRGKRVGDRMLADAVLKAKPRVHCFGHIHESYGTLRQNGTLYCNAAVFNGHPPLVIDVPRDRPQQAVLITDLR